MPDPISFLMQSSWDDLPLAVQEQAELCVLDLIGVAAAGAGTELSRIIRDHAVSDFGASPGVGMLFDDRRASPSGAALAGGMTIDAIDAHDGFNPVKGHIGCALLPAILAIADAQGISDGRSVLTALALGYEIGGRLGISLHDTVSDYHTSGAWMAVACAGIGARLMGLTPDQAAHAIGIAEYHGPRSQMMRCIDRPTMLKDGSGWGAMAGVSAARLAAAGFTGAPGITLDHPAFDDLGSRWLMLEQYYKPYPVCRWAQGPIEGILTLREQYGLVSQDVDHIEIATFHQSIRLACRDPKTTEEAQYSTSYPSAVAMVQGDVGVTEVQPAAFDMPEVQRLSQSVVMVEDDHANACFPNERWARVTLHLKDGRVLAGDYVQPKWGPEAQPSAAELRDKFQRYAFPALGQQRASEIEKSLRDMGAGGSSRALCAALYAAI